MNLYNVCNIDGSTSRKHIVWLVVILPPLLQHFREGEMGWRRNSTSVWVAEALKGYNKAFSGSRETPGLAEPRNLQQRNCFLLRTWLTHSHSKTSLLPVTMVFPSGHPGCSHWFFRVLACLARRYILTQMDVTCRPCPDAQFTFHEKYWRCFGLFLFYFLISAQYLQVLRVLSVYFLISLSCQNLFPIAHFLQGSFKCLLW